MYNKVFDGPERIVFYCAFGERSTLAVRLAKEMGMTGISHLVSGLTEWKKSGLPIEL